MPSLMQQEALHAPAKLAEHIKANAPLWQAIKARLAKIPPPFALTVARGSSDHAAYFAKYLLTTQCGWVSASFSPSMLTLYQAKPQLKNALVLALSQSGQGPDVCEVMRYARAQGAVTVALVNDAASPLAAEAEFVIPLLVGRERAVAATKSFLAMVAGMLQGVAILTESKPLNAALEALPEQLALAAECQWPDFIDTFSAPQAGWALGRGFGLPIAHEAALKCKEVAGLHMEALSSAEVLHGPFALVKPNYPVLLFGQDDATLPGTLEVAERMTALGCKTLLALAEDVCHNATQKVSACLPLPPRLHPLCDPLVAMEAFYLAVERLSHIRGIDPDQPPHLSKVTKTR